MLARRLIGSPLLFVRRSRVSTFYFATPIPPAAPPPFGGLEGILISSYWLCEMNGLNSHLCASSIPPTGMERFTFGNM